MKIFDAASLRLKQELGLTQDKDVAHMLGLSAVAWVGRKKRDNFPSTELFALKTKRPDLDIDVNYVMTGVRQSGQVRALTDKLALQVDAAGSPQHAEDLRMALQLRAAIDSDASRKSLYESMDLKRMYCSDGELRAVLAVMTEFADRRQRELSATYSAASQTVAQSSPVPKVQQNFHAEVGQAIGGGDHMQNTYVAAKRKAKTP